MLRFVDVAVSWRCWAYRSHPRHRDCHAVWSDLRDWGHRLGVGGEEVEIVGPAAHYASNDQRCTAGEGHSSALGQAGDNAAHAALQVGEHCPASR